MSNVFDLPTFWKISAKWASKEIDCTLHGIKNYCGGNCCREKKFWPPKASINSEACERLGPEGCILGDLKPIACLLYPFRLNENNTLVLHVRYLGHQKHCGLCYKKGGKTIAENNKRNFSILFGQEQADMIVSNTLAGKDSYVKVPEWVLKAVAHEKQMEIDNVIPVAREPQENELIR